MNFVRFTVNCLSTICGLKTVFFVGIVNLNKLNKLIKSIIDLTFNTNNIIFKSQSLLRKHIKKSHKEFIVKNIPTSSSLNWKLYKKKFTELLLLD